MPNLGDTLFCPFLTTSTQGIRPNVNIRSIDVLGCQPPEIARGKGRLQRDNSLNGHRRRYAPEKYGNRLPGGEGTAQEFSGVVHGNLFSMLWHVAPRRLVR